MYEVILVTHYFYMYPKRCSWQRAQFDRRSRMKETNSFYYSTNAHNKASNRSKNMSDPESKDVIQILTDEEERKNQQETEENKQLRYEIAKAQLTGNRFNIVLAAAKFYMPFPKQEKDKKLKEHIIEFFLGKANINIMDGHFCPRIDAGLCPEPGMVYQNKYLLFGVDLLTTKKLLTRYSRYKPILKWIDCSHCIFQFESITVGMDFINNQILDFQSETIIPWDQNSNVLAREWLELNTYLELGFERRIFARNLTEKDEQYINSRQSPTELYDVYKNARAEFEKSLLSNEKISKIMQKVEEEERAQKLADPVYKNMLRKKRIQQKKIEHLIQSRTQPMRDESYNRNRSRTRDDERYKNQRNRHLDALPDHQYQSKDYLCHFEDIAYKGNPNVFPERYNLHLALNPKPRPRPPCVTPEKMNQIRQRLKQRRKQRQIQTSYQTNLYKLTFTEQESMLNSNFICNSSNQANLLPNDLIQDNTSQAGSVSNKNLVKMEKVERGSQEIVSQTSSDFNRIQAQLQRVNFNSSDYSSIYEKSKHYYSQVSFQDSQQLGSSNMLNSNICSNIISNQINNSNSNTLFEIDLEEEVGIIPHNDHHNDKIEEQDEDICDFIYNTGSQTQEESPKEGDDEFKSLKKPLNRDEFLELPEKVKEKEKLEELVQFQAAKKCPRKKNVNKDEACLPKLE